MRLYYNTSSRTVVETSHRSCLFFFIADRSETCKERCWNTNRRTGDRVDGHQYDFGISKPNASNARCWHYRKRRGQIGSLSDSATGDPGCWTGGKTSWDSGAYIWSPSNVPWSSDWGFSRLPRDKGRQYLLGTCSCLLFAWCCIMYFVRRLNGFFGTFSYRKLLYCQY